LHLVTEYRQFAHDCRRLAAMLTSQDDKHALELLAAGWDKTAEKRETAILASGRVVGATAYDIGDHVCFGP
jgi:hypothetical protein